MIAVNAFSLSPAKIVLSVDPDDKQVFEIKIKNNENLSVTFKPVVVGVEQNQSGAPVFVSGLTPTESWISFDVKSFVLDPGQEKKIIFTLDVPDNTYPGSYYLGLGAEKISGGKENVNLSSRVLSLVNIKVAGIVNEELKLEKWESINDVWFNSKWKFDLVFKNTGSVELPVSAKMILRNFRGREILEENIATNIKIIPGTTRNIEHVFVLPKKFTFLPGIYQADLVLDYGLTKQNIFSVTKFWYFYPPLLFFVAIIIFLPVLFFLARKIFKRR